MPNSQWRNWAGVQSRRLLYSKLTWNSLAIYLQQLMGAIIPVLILPWLLRIVGDRQLGLLIMMQTVVNYIYLFSDYGFSTTAVRLAALCRGDRRQLSQLATLITGWRLLAALLLGALTGAGLLLGGVSAAAFWLYLACLVQAIGQAVNPTWLYLALEKSFLFAIFMIASRLISILFILLMTRSAADTSLAAFWLSSVFLLAALPGWWYLIRREKIRFAPFSLAQLRQRLTTDWNFFAASLTTSFYASSPPLIVGLLLGEASAGIFGVLYRFVTMLSNLFLPFYQAAYPRLCVLLTESTRRAAHFLKFVHLGSLGIMLLVTAVLWLLAPFAVKLLAANSDRPTILLFMLLVLIPLVISQNGILGTLTLVAGGWYRDYRNAMLITGLFGLAASVLLTYCWGEYGAAAAALGAEILVTILMYAAARRRLAGRLP